MTVPRKREGMIAKTPAQRQAERRARGARAVMLPGDVLAHLDALTALRDGSTRVDCIRALLQSHIKPKLWHE